MKKAPTIVLSAGILFAAVVVPPLFIKPVVQEQLAQWQEEINQQPGYTLVIEPQDDGWFSSDYRATLSYDLAELTPALVNKKATLQLHLMSSYGPLLFSDSINVGITEFVVKVAAEGIPDTLKWDKASPLYRMDITKRLTGKYAFEDKLMPFEMNDEKLGLQLVMGGYESSGSYDDHELTYQATIASLYSNYASTTVLENYQLDGVIQGSLEDVFKRKLVEHSFNVTVDLIAAGNIVVEGMKGTSSTILDGTKQLGKLAATMNANKIGFAEYQAQDVAVDIDFANLNNDFIQKYYEFVTSDLMEAPAQQHPALIGSFLSENLIALLKPNPEINITRLQAKFPEGSIDFEAHSRIEGVDEQLDPMELVGSPPYLLQFVQASASLLIDEPLLNGWAQDYAEQQFKNNPRLNNLPKAEYEKRLKEAQERYLASLLKQGVLVKGNSHYSSEFSFTNGVAVLNDQPVNL